MHRRDNGKGASHGHWLRPEPLPKRAAYRRTSRFGSFSALIRAGTAAEAAGPISPRALMAALRAYWSWSFSALLRAGTAALAAGPILPRAPAARLRTYSSWSFSALLRAGTAAGPILPRASSEKRLSFSADRSLPRRASTALRSWCRRRWRCGARSAAARSRPRCCRSRLGSAGLGPAPRALRRARSRPRERGRPGRRCALRAPRAGTGP